MRIYETSNTSRIVFDILFDSLHSFTVQSIPSFSILEVYEQSNKSWLALQHDMSFRVGFFAQRQSCAEKPDTCKLSAKQVDAKSGERSLYWNDTRVKFKIRKEPLCWYNQLGLLAARVNQLGLFVGNAGSKVIPATFFDH